MTGEIRRAQLLELLGKAVGPVSGAELARTFGVSRQVVVQDVALLRQGGAHIASTNRGYVLEGSTSKPRRLFKAHHEEDQIAQELNAIVDLGGTVEDVVVNHRTYGLISAHLNVSNRRDVRNFLADLATSKSTPLMSITSGYHFHHVSAESEEVLDEIEHALTELGFIAQRLPYEESMT